MLEGLRILSFEVRRAAEMQTLLGKQGGRADFVATFREVTNEVDPDVLEFGAELITGHHPLVLCLTGVAVKRLLEQLSTRFDAGDLVGALRATVTMCRGPKPSAALREMGVTPTVVVGEPNTWREVLALMESRTEPSVAVIEYGRPDERLLEGLIRQGRAIRRVPVYHYDLPADTEPMREAVRRIAAGEYDVCLFTSSVQYHGLAEIARQLDLTGPFRAGLNRAYVAAIGPTMAETLADDGVTVDFEPSHAKMGIFVSELARQPIREAPLA